MSGGCFNGAMTLRSWRGDSGLRSQVPEIWLQWGHDLAVMESGIPSTGSGPAHALQWGHDLAVMERVLERLSPDQFRHRRSKVLGQAPKLLMQCVTAAKHSTLHPASTAVVDRKPASGLLYGGSSPDRSQSEFVRLFACEPHPIHASNRRLTSAPDMTGFDAGRSYVPLPESEYTAILERMVPVTACWGTM